MNLQRLASCDFVSFVVMGQIEPLPAGFPAEETIINPQRRCARESDEKNHEPQRTRRITKEWICSGLLRVTCPSW
jgi:hypothetical protein